MNKSTIGTINNRPKEEQGITLISLIVTIIILLILAGITLALISGNDGILGRAAHALDENKIAMAKEQVELVLSDFQTEFFEGKYVEQTSNGSKKDHISEKLQQGVNTKDFYVKATEDGVVKVYENRNGTNSLVITGTIQEDASIAWDGENKTDSEEIIENNAIQIAAVQKISGDYVKGILSIEITYEGNITEITFNGEVIEVPVAENGVYKIEKEITENGEYAIIAKDENGKQKKYIENVTEITEDMEIWNREDMETFRNKVNSGRTFQGRTATVRADINLEGSATNQWVPIRNFKGTFEGSNYFIDNLYIHSSSQMQALFFTNYGTIRNVKLKAGTVNGGEYAAGLVAYNYGNVIRCMNLNTKVYARNSHRAGGLVAENANLVKECYNAASVTLENSDKEVMVGGVVGANSKDLYTCYNSGTISGVYSKDINFNIGGVVGYITGAGSIGEGLYNIGKVTAKKTTTLTNKTIRIGGVCGTVFPNGASLKYSYNIGSVTATASPVSKIFLGSVVGDVDRGTAQYLYSNGQKVVGNVEGSGITSNCYTTISNDINSQYFAKDEAGINSGYPVLKWQIEKN